MNGGVLGGNEGKDEVKQAILVPGCERLWPTTPSSSAVLPSLQTVVPAALACSRG